MKLDYVCVDLGASDTRVENASGNVRVLPNNMCDVTGRDSEADRVEPNDNSLESNIDVTINKIDGAECSYFPVRAMYGKMAERFSISQVRPNSMEHKSDQQVNYVSAILGAATQRLSEGTGEDIVMFIAVPPVEINKARDKFAQLLGRYEVKFNKYLNGAKVIFNVVSVVCKSESELAMASMLFSQDGKPRPEHKTLFKKKVLSVDIGASTSDLCVCINGKPVEVAGRTYKVGGNVARAYFINLIRENFGFDMSLSDAEIAIAEGRMQMGDSYVDVSEYVKQSKMQLAERVVQSLQTYFNEIDMPIQSFNAVAVSGGGSMRGQYVDENSNDVITTSEPLSSFVIEPLKKICSTIEVVHYGEDARYANIYGLALAAKAEMPKIEAKLNLEFNVAVEQQVAQPQVETAQVTSTVAEFN